MLGSAHISSLFCYYCYYCFVYLMSINATRLDLQSTNYDYHIPTDTQNPNDIVRMLLLRTVITWTLVKSGTFALVPDGSIMWTATSVVAHRWTRLM